MTGVLGFVTLPQATERRLHSDTDLITLAKIRLLQEALRMQEAQVATKLSESDLKEVDESVKSIEEQIIPTELFSTITVAAPRKVPEFLSVRDVSKLTGRVPQVVRRHCASGKYIAEQVAGENGTWRIKPEQFMHLSNWDSFLAEREKEIESSIRIADHALALWQNEGPVDNGSE